MTDWWYNMNQPLVDKMAEACSTLKLSGLFRGYQVIADECARDGVSYTDYLKRLLDYELECRAHNGRQTVLKMAGFPTLKTMEMFDFKESAVNKTQITELATLRFIANAENVILLGSSGTGKTHLAISLGYLATQQRYRVRFFTAADLLLQLEVASNQNRLEQYLNKVIAGSRLLIIDEFGYVKLNETQANLFFQLVNKRYETGAIIITSNLIFTKWQEVLNNDEALTAAILDRLIHHSHIINVQGDSYRLKQKRKAGIIPV